MPPEPTPNQAVIVHAAEGHALPPVIADRVPIDGVVVGPAGSLLEADLWVVDIPDLHNTKVQLHRSQFSPVARGDCAVCGEPVEDFRRHYPWDRCEPPEPLIRGIVAPPSEAERKMAEELAFALAPSHRHSLSERSLEALEDHVLACRAGGSEPSREVIDCLDGFRGKNNWPVVRLPDQETP